MSEGNCYLRYEAGMRFFALLADWRLLMVSDVCTVYELEDAIAVGSGMREYE